jgi:hypothetical protein
MAVFIANAALKCAVTAAGTGSVRPADLSKTTTKTT